MIQVFYDFETSSLSLSGQVISYCFLALSNDGSLLQELSGLVTLTRCELPDLDALLITRLSIQHLHQYGKPEPTVALEIFTFLFNLIEAHGKIVLCGYNSNQFDLKFLRSLLIRHGLNPYFYGKIEYRDVLHWVRYLGMSHTQFPMQLHADGYWTFSLEQMARAHGVTTLPQTHNAIDDVQLTIHLVSQLETIYGTTWMTQPTIQSPPTHSVWLKHRIGTPPERIQSIPVFPLFSHQNTLLLLQLDTIPFPFPDTLMECRSHIEYVNYKTGFLWASLAPTDVQSTYQPIIDCIRSHPVLCNIDVESFFSLSPPTDIELAITNFPLPAIHSLHHYIKQCHQDWESAPHILQSVHSVSQDNHHLTQLLHRYYLNHAPNINQSHLSHYLEYRHLTGGVDPKRNIESLRKAISTAHRLLDDSTQDCLTHQIASGYLERVKVMVGLS